MPELEGSIRSPALGRRRCLCGQGMVRTRAPGRRPHRRPGRCRGRSPVVVVPVQRRNHPLRPGTVPLSRREASPSAGWRMPVVMAQMVQRRRRRHAGPPVQWRAPERSEGGCGDGRRGDGGSRLRGDDGYPVQSGGENHCRCRGDGCQPRGHGAGNRHRGGEGCCVEQTWGLETLAGGSERKQKPGYAGESLPSYLSLFFFSFP